MRKAKSYSSDSIDLNAATVEELVAAGFSSAQAEAVLGYAAEHGPWTNVEQLLLIEGIDTVALEALRPHLYVAPIALLAVDGDRSTPTDADSCHIEATIDATHEEAGGLGRNESESQPEGGSGSLQLEAEDLYPVAGAVVDDEYWPEPVFAELPSADVTSPDSMAPPPTESVAIAGSDIAGELPAILSEDKAGSHSMGMMGAAPVVGRWSGESTIADQAQIPVSTWEDGSQDFVEEMADLPADMPSSADERSAIETHKARIADLEGEGTQGPEAAAVDEGLLDVAAPEGDEPVSYASHIERTEAARADVAGEATDAMPGVRGESEPAPVHAVADNFRPDVTGPPPPAKPSGKSRWHDLALVAVGGLLGVLATLVILGVLGGTLNYAPRSLVDALSANISTMQQNQETSWSRTQALSAQVTAMESRLAAVEALGNRVADLESGSAEIEARLVELRTGLQKVDASLAEVAQQHASLIEDLGTRVAAQEQALSSIGETVSELHGKVDEMEDQVSRYEAFFDALRDLLLEMQGEGTGADTGM